MLGESSSTIVNVCVRSFGLSAGHAITLRPAMYVPDSYRAPNPEAAGEIIAGNPCAVLVSCTDEAPLASHIPAILDREGEPGGGAAET
jgi:Putative FMN-binding domain